LHHARAQPQEAIMTLLKSMTGAFALAVACAFASGCDGSARSSDEVTEARSGLVKGPAGNLYVSDGGGGGLPVVFVHSFAGSSDHWQAQLDHLREARRALALDLRGHGRSQAPNNDDYSVDALATDIGAVVDAKGLERFVLVGHSMGGSASASYAGAHADRVAGLMLVGTPGKSAPEKAQQTLAALNADYQKTMDSYWQSLVDGAKPEVADRLIAQGKQIPPDSLHNEQPEIPQVMITGTSHWPQLDKPDEFNAALDQFLADAERVK
jgi:pimeloyl-ACP methyl ester carboxylesterase